MVMRINLTTRQWAFTILGLILVLYIIFQARFLILGPQISINTPEDAQEVLDPVLVINGKAKNVAWLSLNGRQIFTDENGLWSEKLLLSPGTSIMTLTAHDRFGRQSQEQVRVILIKNSPDTTI